MHVHTGRTHRAAYDKHARMQIAHALITLLVKIYDRILQFFSISLSQKKHLSLSENELVTCRRPRVIDEPSSVPSRRKQSNGKGGFFNTSSLARVSLVHIRHNTCIIRTSWYGPCEYVPWGVEDLLCYLAFRRTLSLSYR